MVLLQGACKFASLLNPLLFVSSRISTSQITYKVSVEEKLGIKPKPKRPPSTFLRFVAQVRPQILLEKPKASVVEINQIASLKWRAADNKVKQSLLQDYKNDWAKYQTALRNYNQTLSPVEREEIQKALSAIAENKEKKKLKQKMDELGKPKKPPSSFVLFMKSKILERGSKPYKEWLEALKAEWEKAPESLKASLNEQYKREFETYKSKLGQWERQMESQGQSVLVRKQRT